MSKSPISVGAYLATVTETERKIITDAQDKLRAERSLGNGPQGTIELPLQKCQEAVSLHRKGRVSARNLASVLDWVLRNPDNTQSIEAVVAERGLLHMHERGNPQGEIDKLAASHEQWRQTYAQDPVRGINEATRAVMVSGRGMCNPVDIKTAVMAFFASPSLDAGPDSR